MALFHGRQEINAVNWGPRAIAVIYKGIIKVWEAIRSCFGKGFWLNEYSWNNTDAWKNNI